MSILYSSSLENQLYNDIPLKNTCSVVIALFKGHDFRGRKFTKMGFRM